LTDLTLGITLKADGSGLVGEVKLGQDALDKLGKEGKRAGAEGTKGLDTMGAALGRMKSAVVATIAAYASFQTVQRIIGAATREIMAAEKATANLNAVLRATGGTVGFTADELSDMADELEQATLFDGEQIKQAEAVMLTFRQVQGDTFREAIGLATDLAALMGGDLQGAVLQLGKALEDPVEGISALRRSGISFSESQRDLIKSLVETGDQAQAMRIILDGVAGQIGGVAKEQVTGLTGALNELDDVYGDILKAFGNYAPLVGAAQGFAEIAVQARDAIQAFTDPQSEAGLQAQLAGLLDQRRQIEEMITGVGDGSFLGWLDSALGGEEKLAMYQQRLAEINDAIRFVEAALANAARSSSGSVEQTSLKVSSGGNDIVSDKVGGVIADLVFQEQQLHRTAEAQELYNQLRQAGVDIDSAAGQQIERLVFSIQAQRDAQAGVAEEQKVWNDVVQEGARLTEEVQTPMEAYIERLQYLGEMLDRNAISQETFNRQVQLAQSDLESATASLEGVGAENDFLGEAFNQMGVTAVRNLTDILLHAKNAEDALGALGEKILEIAAQQLFLKPLEQLFGGMFGGGGGMFGGGGGGGFGGFLWSIFGSLFGSGGGVNGLGIPFGHAKGAAFQRGAMVPFANGGIVNQPTLFPMANGAGLMGEAGPEAIMPLDRDSSGRLGVRASGGSVEINIHNYSGQPVEQRQRQAGDGRTMIDLIIGAVKADLRQRGELAQTFEGTYGLGRRGF